MDFATSLVRDYNASALAVLIKFRHDFVDYNPSSTEARIAHHYLVLGVFAVFVAPVERALWCCSTMKLASPLPYVVCAPSCRPPAWRTGTRFSSAKG